MKQNKVSTRTVTASRKDFYRPTRRDQFMLQLVDSKIRRYRSREDLSNKRLQLFFWGQGHSLDYFFATLDKDLSYAGLPLGRDRVSMGTPEYAEFRRLLGADYMRIIGKLKPLDLYPFSDEVAYDFLSQQIRSLQLWLVLGKKITASDLLADANPVSEIILFSDFHSLNETSPIRNFPMKKELADSGIAGIDAYFEGLKARPQGYYIQAALDRFDFKENVIQANRFDLVTKSSPEAAHLLESGKVQDGPEILAFLEKLKSLRESGFSVTLNGLEP